MCRVSLAWLTHGRVTPRLCGLARVASPRSAPLRSRDGLANPLRPWRRSCPWWRSGALIRARLLALGVHDRLRLRGTYILAGRSSPTGAKHREQSASDGRRAHRVASACHSAVRQLAPTSSQHLGLAPRASCTRSWLKPPNSSARTGLCTTFSETALQPVQLPGAEAGSVPRAGVGGARKLDERHA